MHKTDHIVYNIYNITLPLTTLLNILLKLSCLQNPTILIHIYLPQIVHFLAVQYETMLDIQPEKWITINFWCLKSFIFNNQNPWTSNQKYK